MAVVGLLLEGPETAVLALCHDMAECIIGDITPHCKVINWTPILIFIILSLRNIIAAYPEYAGLPGGQGSQGDGCLPGASQVSPQPCGGGSTGGFQKVPLTITLPHLFKRG